MDVKEGKKRKADEDIEGNNRNKRKIVSNPETLQDSSSSDSIEDIDMDEILSRQAEKARKKKRRMVALQAGHNVDDSEEEEDNRTYTDPGTIEQMYHGNVPLDAFNMSEEIKDRVLNIEKGSKLCSQDG
eukprot:TRINITY_DN165_c0_g2_i31.p1 TRINITY_DN165_c0_g2~~TRINITY_DN165_c0_g2_i31.p1  ORF type:complete len:129 (-),score=26.15 TRINITY_DN165_c0_g2_i31:202-588(-)